MSWWTEQTGSQRGKMAIKCASSLGVGERELMLFWVSIHFLQNGHLQKTNDNKCRWDRGETGTIQTSALNANLFSHYENHTQASQKTKNRSPYGPAIPLSAIHTKDSKSIYHRDPCTVFTAAQYRGNGTSLDLHPQMNDNASVVHRHNRILFCHKQKWNHGTWVKMKIIMLSKTSSSERCCKSSLIVRT